MGGFLSAHLSCLRLVYIACSALVIIDNVHDAASYVSWTMNVFILSPARAPRRVEINGLPKSDGFISMREVDLYTEVFMSVWLLFR